MEFACKNTTLLAATNEKTLMIVKTGSGNLNLHQLPAECMSIAISHCGIGLCGLLSGAIYIFNEKEPTVPIEIVNTGKPIGCVSISKDGTRVAVCSADKYVSVYCLEHCEAATVITNAFLLSTTCHSRAWVWGCILSQCGRYAMTCHGGYDNDTQFWDLSDKTTTTPRFKLSFQGGNDRFESFDVSKDAKVCVMACKSGVLRVWDIDEQCVHSVAELPLEIKDVSISSSSICVCGLSDGSIRVVDLCYESRLKILALTKSKLNADVLKRLKTFVCW
jgi:WD40 repeat protein